MTNMRWKRFYPDGSRLECWRYALSGYPIVYVSQWSPEYGYVGDYSVCEACSEVEEAGGHHRTGCPHADVHRLWCSRCKEQPPLLPAVRFEG